MSKGTCSLQNTGKPSLQTQAMPVSGLSHTLHLILQKFSKQQRLSPCSPSVGWSTCMHRKEKGVLRPKPRLSLWKVHWCRSASSMFQIPGFKLKWFWVFLCVCERGWWHFNAISYISGEDCFCNFVKNPALVFPTTPMTVPFSCTEETFTWKGCQNNLHTFPE